MSNIEFVDTHCHLQFDKLAANVEQVIASAKDAGVIKLICVGTSLADSQKAIEYAGKYKNIWATVGIHPHEAKSTNLQGGSLKIKGLLNKPKVVAVGETGLDYYKNYSPKAEQERLFCQLIELGAPRGLPFVFHIRDAWEDFWRIYDSYQSASQRIRGVVHSFSAGSAELDQALSRGLYVALNGIMTFTGDKSQLAAAKEVPEDRLLLETDAPFLAPKPYRGKVCEPKHVRDTAEFLAHLRDESINDLATYTTANAIKLFGLQ